MNTWQRVSSIAAAAFLVGSMAGQAAAQTTVEWWVISGGGAPSSAGGGALLANDTLGQAVSGAVAGESGEVSAGYWQQLFGPAAIVDLRASIAAGPLMQLDWTPVQQDTAGHSIGGVTYDAYRGTNDPYFAPGMAYRVDVTLPFVDDSDPSVIGNTVRSTYYVVKSVYGGLPGAESNRVGAFAFALTPGGF